MHANCRLVAAGRRAAVVFLLLLACPSASWAQASAAAEVTRATGRVSILRDGEEWALFAGQRVEVGQTIVTGANGFAELRVSDGSVFMVFPNSHVVFRNNPGSLWDLLDVMIGRIKAYIQSVEPDLRPYRLFTPTAVISVRGTVFDVQVSQDETTILYVEQGRVGVEHRLLPSGKQVEVGAGQSLTIYPGAPLAKANIDTVKAVKVAGDIARTLAYIWSRTGGGGGSAGGSGGGGGTPLPGDTEAPEPPPPPPPPPAPGN